jgi:2-C-methyl-D-erythritol 4-phosphate cytidylyltransferase/2-C-methyl-D-erythritol 2,4-cyclodiphosphate synthase
VTPAAGRTAGVDAVIVAAGGSTRMGGLDKLGATIGGRSLLAWTVAGLAGTPIVERIVLVADPDRLATLLGEPALAAELTSVVRGGRRRQESVAAGVAELERLDGDRAADDRVILIHDGARPLVTADLVARVASAAAEHGAAIPVVAIAETVKRTRAGLVVATVDRSDLATAQTPQGFRRSVLRAAYERFDPSGELEWTDEAALCESCTIAVHVVPGDPSNLKVTRPIDLARVAEALGRPEATRVGVGHDSHPFGPATPLMLGGVEIAGAPRLHGHSDGDAVLHAVADALLGATGLGDLGRIHPAGPETPVGVASGELLADVAIRLAERGWRPASLDVTVVGSRPRLAPHLEAMRVAIAGLLELPVDAVSVKASSGNLSGDTGAGRAIAAEAVVTVVPRAASEPAG